MPKAERLGGTKDTEIEKSRGKMAQLTQFLAHKTSSRAENHTELYPSSKVRTQSIKNLEQNLQRFRQLPTLPESAALTAEARKPEDPE